MHPSLLSRGAEKPNRKWIWTRTSSAKGADGRRADVRAKALLALFFSCAACPGFSHTEAGHSDAGNLGGILEPGESARASLEVPPEGARSVPPNLRRIVLGAPADPGPLLLVGPDGGQVELRPSGETPACAQPWCAQWELAAALSPLVHYEIKIGPQTLAFETGAEEDTRPPALLARNLELEGGCAIARMSSDEPVTVVLLDGVGKTIARRDTAALEHELGGTAGMGPRMSVLLSDLAGNTASAEWPYEPPDLPRIAITEVLSNPLGPEPAQEWVELKNLGDLPIPVGGLEIAAGMSVDALPDAILAPGVYGLIVTSTFESSGGLDPPVPPEVPLLRLAGATIGAGLRNGPGGMVELRNQSGQVVSRYTGFFDFGMGTAAGSSAIRVDESGCNLKNNWRLRPHPTPGEPG